MAMTAEIQREIMMHLRGELFIIKKYTIIKNTGEK